MSEISFFTNDELIKELLSRSTFAGIIIKPASPIEEIQSQAVIQFDMMWNPVLPNHTVQTLLEEALQNLKD